MREEVRTLYYCDYCNKRYISKYWAKQHELHCTLNPNRICRMCDHNGTDNNIPKLLDEFYEMVKKDNMLPRFEVIRVATGNCPNCILTILRQFSKDPRFKDAYEPFDTYAYMEWEYQKEVKEFWRKVNEEQYSNTGLY
jgi:hypothetical protein